ncbi:MAG TPA: PD-(D/E)XK nuclease family protein [Acidimicrobiales bacterium]|nr:PD-(D/E)XK nuclease family protein [Acidimicrobiales bacterium]
MSPSVRLARYGDQAHQALAGAVADAKRDDPLQVVTVVVSRGTVGLAARRRLAAVPPGLCNVRFLTLGRLAATLGDRQPGRHRRPASQALVHEAVRLALAERTTGFLAAARHQPATVRAVVRTYGELRAATPAALAALARQSARAAEVVDLVAAVRDRLGDWMDDVDAVALATAEVARDPAAAARTAGPVVVHLPRRLGPADRQLLLALDHCVPVTVVVGTTGDPEADQLADDLLAGLGVPAGPKPVPQPAPAPGETTVVAAPSADAEVLLAVRRLMGANAAGTPLERTAIAYGGASPYPTLVRDALEAAGIPFNGVGVRSLASTVAGRTLLGLLELADHDWRRDQVAAWLSSAPLRHRGRPVPGPAWDVLSVEAGVVSGLAEWRERPMAYAAALRARSAAQSDPSAVAATERDARLCEELSAFAGALAGRLADQPDRWEGWARWGRALLAALLGGPEAQEDWPAGKEVAALDAVHECLDGLAALDGLGGGRPALADFRAALSVGLDVPAPQTSRFGHGVLVGRVADMVGLDLDLLCVVGMADGAFPERSADDVLVPDRERESSGADVPRRTAAAAEGRRDYLAALASARTTVLSFAAGDQRQGRALRPCRLLLDTLGAVAGADRRLYAGDLAALAPGPGYEAVPSYAAAVAGRPGSAEPASPADWDLQQLVRTVQAGRRVDRHFLSRTDPVLAAGLELRRERRRPVFTRFDGRLDGATVSSPADPSAAAASATGLESFATCPRRYLFGTVLGITVRDRPEAVLRLGGPERGILVHGILERFVADQLARPADQRVRPTEPWGPDAYERMDRIAGEAFAAVERQGLAGRLPLWEMDRSAVLADLRQFLRDDDRYRQATGAIPEAVEQRFGRDDATTLPVALGDGRVVRFRGTVDRIDRTADGGLSVLDYKTGGRRAAEGLDDDPVVRGTRLQLALYALAAARRYRPVGPVATGYWFVADRRGQDRPAQEGFTMTPATEHRLRQVLRTLVGAIEAGRFPANPGDAGDGRSPGGANCRTCPFDRVCPADRWRAWTAKRGDPWAADYVALAEAG